MVSNSTPEKSVGSIPLRNPPTIASFHSNGVLKNEGNGIYEADLTSTEPDLILWIKHTSKLGRRNNGIMLFENILAVYSKP